ncbi:MAG: hypothetical protein KatS3mg060_3529 [Dehalococcoidia bacterium]|nr:MAG: hypothetical protein KatS3mg060_3529 [Dehalococcoidia bacterium]
MRPLSDASVSASLIGREFAEQDLGRQRCAYRNGHPVWQRGKGDLMHHWGSTEASWRRIVAAVAGLVLLLALVVPAAPADAQDLFCEYDPSILVQTDSGPVLIHLFFRTSRLIDTRAVEGMFDDAQPIHGLTARSVREHGVVLAERDSLLRYLEANTSFRVARVQRNGGSYDIEVQSFVAGALRLELTAYLAFDRDDPTPTFGLRPIKAPSPFMQQNPWIHPAPGFQPDVFSNFDTERTPGMMDTTIRISESDIRAQQSRIRLTSR